MTPDDECICPGEALGLPCPMTSGDPDPVPEFSWKAGGFDTITWWSDNQPELFWHRLGWLMLFLDAEPQLCRPDVVANILAHLLESIDGVAWPNSNPSRRTRALVRMKLSVSYPTDCCSYTEAEAELERQLGDDSKEW